jgi:hypothetical protein
MPGKRNGFTHNTQEKNLANLSCQLANSTMMLKKTRVSLLNIKCVPRFYYYKLLPRYL